MPDPHRTAYVSGPMRGLPHFNFPAFDEARDMFNLLGIKVISPADMDRAVGITGEDDLPSDDPAVKRSFADRDTQAIIQNLKAENRDMLALLPGWENSVGAFAEIAVARMVGLDVVIVDYTKGVASGWHHISIEEVLDVWALNWASRRKLTKVPVSAVKLTN